MRKLIKITVFSVLAIIAGIAADYIYRFFHFNPACLWTTVTKNHAPSDRMYSFLVAGHAYGAHWGENPGLYPKFLEVLKDFKRDKGPDFVIFSGDFIRDPDRQSWSILTEELSDLGIPHYFVMGNHEAQRPENAVGLEMFRALYGEPFYRFNVAGDLFVILDSQHPQSRRISGNQLVFLEKALEDYPDSDRIFIFFHELLWNSSPKFKDVKANTRSLFKKLTEVEGTNYWTELDPIFKANPERNFYVIAGDTGGSELYSGGMFYFQYGNVTLLASGMGEVQEENFLSIDVSKDKVQLEFIPLNPGVSLCRPEDYPFGYFEMKKRYLHQRAIGFLRNQIARLYG